MEDKDMARPDGPGSRPTGQAASHLDASHLDASRFDPSRGALGLIREIGIYGLGGNEGCPCTSFEVQNVRVDVSCHKSEQSVRVYSDHFDYFEGGAGEPYRRNTASLEPIAQEVLRQVDAYYDADGEYAAGFTVYFSSWEEDRRDEEAHPNIESERDNG